VKLREAEWLLLGVAVLAYVEQRRTRRKVDALLALATADPVSYDSLRKRVIDRVLDVPLNLVLP
jgi:hypothetical protein